MAAQSVKVFGRGGDGGEQNIAHHVAPRPSALLVAAQSHAAPEREQGIGDAAQHNHDDGRSRVLLDPWVVVFCEGRVEDLMGGFDSPVATHDEQPLRIRQPRAGQARNEVAVFNRDAFAFLVEGLDLDTEHGAQVVPAFWRGAGFADVEPTHHGVAVVEVAAGCCCLCRRTSPSQRTASSYSVGCVLLMAIR